MSLCGGVVSSLGSRLARERRCRMYWSIVITSAAVGLAAVGAILWFWWWRFPKRQVGSPGGSLSGNRRHGRMLKTIFARRLASCLAGPRY